MKSAVLLLICGLLSSGFGADGGTAAISHEHHALIPPLQFPLNSDSMTPIVSGNDPKQSKLPPKKFPTADSDHDPTGPPILNGTEANITEIKHISQALKQNTSSDVPLKPPKPTTKQKKISEQEDMLHSKYEGGEDVDELKLPKKASEKDEKKITLPKENPKSEIEVSSTLDKNGPRLMNNTKVKPPESMLESTSTVMAVSSSILSNTSSRSKHHEVLEPAKTVLSVLLTAAVCFSLAVIGLLVWKRIAMRRFGRDVLINEEDFDDVADMHTFDRAQIQIT